jgi:hypothetical protein
MIAKQVYDSYYCVIESQESMFLGKQRDKTMWNSVLCAVRDEML